jgi:hypothetical protein
VETQTEILSAFCYSHVVMVVGISSKVLGLKMRVLHQGSHHQCDFSKEV